MATIQRGRVEPIDLNRCLVCGFQIRGKGARKKKYCCQAHYFQSRGKRAANYHIEWQRRNRDKCRAYSKNDYEKNKQERVAANVRYRRKKYRTDPLVNATCRLRARLNEALRYSGSKKTSSFRSLVGCSKEELRAHLESTFKPGMTWRNRSKWHIDHRRPVSSFNLTKERDQKACFHYTNLQCLWSIDNLQKGAKTENQKNQTHE